MKKRQLHHLWTKLRWIKPWYFLTIAVVSGVVCIFALRANNQHMAKLRNSVYAADEAGTDVQTPLKELQAYVTTHMNTNLSTGNNAVYPPIQLKNTYDQLIKAQSDQVNQANTRLYNAAQAYCEQQNSTDFSGRNRVPCIEKYVQSHNTGNIPTIPDALYKFAFVTPVWSPDLAGWSMVVAALSGALFVISFIVSRWFRRHI